MDKKLEFSTLIGIVGVFTLMVAAILSGTGEVLAFFDLPSALIVIGGTFFITCASFSITDVIKALSVSGQTLLYTNFDRKDVVTTCVIMADQAKREGIISLQRNSNIYGNMHSFFKHYLGLVIDGLSNEDTERLIIQEIISIRERHKKAIEILRKGGEVAPAMGLVGTLIGLVQMLGNLSDPTKIGPAMAVALLTTLYGALIAYVILLPLANKLEKNSKEEIELLRIYGEAIIGVAKRESALKLEMRMNANLSPDDRIQVYS